MSAGSWIGYSREGDIVTVRMSVDDWHGLERAIGVAAAADHPDRFQRYMALLNRLERGNPNWEPYVEPVAARRVHSLADEGADEETHG
jgi:hypothetical protein